MAAAALAALDGAAGDGLGDGEQVLEIERGVPAGVVFAVAIDGDFRRRLLELLNLLQRAGHFILAAHDADEVCIVSWRRCCTS